MGSSDVIGAVIIDQHFSERGRMGRLLAVFAANPGLLAVGLDENAAVVFDGAGMLETLGSGMVTFIDGRRSPTTSNGRRGRSSASPAPP